MGRTFFGLFNMCLGRCSALEVRPLMQLRILKLSDFFLAKIFSKSTFNHQKNVDLVVTRLAKKAPSSFHS